MALKPGGERQREKETKFYQKRVKKTGEKRGSQKGKVMKTANTRIKKKLKTTPKDDYWKIKSRD